LEPTRKTRRGFYRWLILLLIAGNVAATIAFSPIRPHVQVPAETLAGPVQLPVLGELYLTNTLLATLIADLILIAMAFSVRRGIRANKAEPLAALRGVAGVVETLLEGLHGLVESTAGKWAGRILPWMVTIVLMVLIANWTELIPGVDSIGWLHVVHGDVEGYPARELFRVGELKVSAIVNEPVTGHGEAYGVIPFVRVASTDLNFTVALALTAVIAIQVVGVMANGPGYFTKFFNFRDAARMWVRQTLGPFEVIMPFLNVFVGLLELVAEIAKIISFGFRLFGNIFAGSVLLFVLGSLVPVFVQSGVLLFEMFVGVIQALVFGMLTMVFMTMATQSHGEHAEEHAAAHA
jgi:F-type H+-transporting ATPase subunit a